MPVGNRGLGLLLAVVLALMALARQSTAPLTNVAVAEAAQVEAKPKGEGEAAGLQAKEPDARAIPERASNPCSAGDELLEQYARLYWRSSTQQAFRFLVVLVPDPEESGHTDYFDAVLEGIEDAAAGRWLTASAPGVTRYVRDRHWLPWSRSDRAKRQSRCWEQVPGVIIFRPGDEPRRHPALAVLLVGETPTWGAHPAALQAALMRGDSGLLPEHAAEVKSEPRVDFHQILGPSFSGTAPSLRALLEEHAHLWAAERSIGTRMPESAKPRARFEIASGTATGDDVERLLVAPGADDAGASPEVTLEVSYTAAVPSFQTLLLAMRALLNEAGGDSALLSESGTAYGESQEGRSAASSASVLLYSSFPPNLISLRKAYEDVRSSAANAEPVLTRAPSDGNVVPAELRGELSEQTAIAHDLALAEVLRELGRQSIRNVGIVATDARDVIFIAERVGRQLSDVRLFTIGDDIRYLHPDHTKALNGLLVAHAAPTAEGNWSSTANQNPMTRNVSAAGQLLLGGQLPSPRARVSLIGNGSIRQISPDIDEYGRVQLRMPEVPRSFRLTHVLTLVVLMVVLLVVSGPHLLLRLVRPGRYNPLSDLATRGAFLRQRSAFWSWSHRIDQHDLAADDSFATAALVSVVACAVLMMTAVLLRLDSPTHHYATLGAVVLLLLTVWRPCLTRGRDACASAIVMASAMSAVAFAATSLGCSRPRETLVWLLSGASPLIGGLLGMAMLLVVAWCWRTRLRSLDLLRFGAVPGSSFEELRRHPPVALVLGYQPEAEREDPVVEHERRFLQILRSPWGVAPLVPILINGALLASVATVHVLRPVLTFEPGFRHEVLFGVVVACLLPATTGFARLIVTSRALLRLLRSVAGPEMLAALSRLPKGLARRLESQLVNAGRHASDLQHPVYALGRLAQIDPSRARVAAACAGALQDQLRYEAGVPLTATMAACPARLVDRLLDEANQLYLERAQQPAHLRALADDFRACLVAIFVSRYVSQMRSMIPPVLVGCVLGILMTSLYFVQPRHLIATVCFIWVTVIVLVIIAIYFSLARDALLSAIGRTEAGAISLSWGLATRVGAVTVVPLAGLIASQYPEFAFWVTSLLGSVTQFVQ